MSGSAKSRPTIARLVIAAMASIAAAATATSAHAQPTAPDALAGAWTIGRTSEWPDTCSLVLTRNQTIGGFEVRLKPGCAAAFKWTADIAAWRTAEPNELVLQDAIRHALIHFTRGEDEDWIGPGPDRQDYIITRDQTGQTARKKPR
eukprot:gene10960-11042_t